MPMAQPGNLPRESTRVLVTGGAGYIGSHAAQTLIDHGYQVVVFDNLNSGFTEAIPTKAEFVQGDINNTQLVEEVLLQNKISAILHFAALTIVPHSMLNPLAYYRTNTGGTIELARAAVRCGVNKFIFSSTAAVYGNTTASYVSEADPLLPESPYGRSKLFAEQVLRDISQASPLRHMILRYFNVAGAQVNLHNGQRTKDATHLVKVAAQAAAGHRPGVTIYGTDYPTPDGTGVRDFVHVQDLAEAHVLALDYLCAGGSSEVLNVGYGQGFSVREVLETMSKVCGRKFEILEAERRSGDLASVVTNPNRIRELLNWKPQFNSLETICKTAYEWEIKNRQVEAPALAEINS